MSKKGYKYPTASELAQRLQARRAGMGEAEVTAVGVHNAKKKRSAKMKPAAGQSAPDDAPVVTAVTVEPASDANESQAGTDAAGMPKWLPEMHSRYLAGEKVRELAGEVGIPWQRLLRLFGDAGLPKRDGEAFGELKPSPGQKSQEDRSTPGDCFDVVGLAAHLGVSDRWASNLIATLPGAYKLRGKWVVPKDSVSDPETAQSSSYLGVRELAEHLGITQNAARELIVTLPSARKFGGRWVALKKDVPDVVSEEPTERAGTDDLESDALESANDARIRDLHGHYMAGEKLTLLATTAGMGSWQDLTDAFRRLGLSRRDGQQWAELPRGMFEMHPANEPMVVGGGAQRNIAESWALSGVGDFLNLLQESVESVGGRLGGRIRLELRIEFGNE